PSPPLLAIRRAETLALCDDQGLEPVRDPMNDDRRFLRNRIRAELLPLCSELAGRDVVPILARQAELLAGDADVLEAVASMVDATDAGVIAAVPEPVSRRVVRAWLTGDGPYPPSRDAVDRVLDVARGKRRAAQVKGGTRVARTRGRMSKTTSGPAAGANAGAAAGPIGRWAVERTDTVGP
ncbi:MAG: TilS substrate-binding domain-containing protein, partial [Acidimicrobiales bacterium]